tara:strand:- start:110 stop:310 length:201 start_codon:yes stop_codon:yes gene_type:complete
MPNNYTNFNKDKSSTEITSNNQVRTTDINVLLNRVRLNKKKTFKKKLLFSFLLASLICSIAIYLII